MAISRSFLKGMGLTDEQVSAIVEAHAETVDALKAQRDAYKEDADKLKDVQKKLDEALANNSGDWQRKYEELKTEYDEFKATKEEELSKVQNEFDTYKNAQTEKETMAQKREAYKKLLSDAGVSDKRADTILKVTDLSVVEFNKDMSVRNADKLIEGIKSEWAEFISVGGTQGAKVENPPANTGGGMTKEAIFAITDRAERRKAIAENLNLFGKGE